MRTNESEHRFGRLGERLDEARGRAKVLEKLLVDARDVMRCEVSRNPCNTDARVVGSPPCCESCRVHLQILKALRGPEDGTRAGSITVEDAERSLEQLARVGFRLLSREDNGYRQAADWARKYVENTTECTILPKSRNMAMWFLRLEAENQELRRRIMEIENGDQ